MTKTHGWYTAKGSVFFAGWYAGILFFAMGIPINVHNQYHTAGGWFFGTKPHHG